MTDNYGSDNQKMDSDHENEMTAETETWQDDQPPVDDFADHVPEETATVSEEETDMPEGGVEQDAPSKKTSVALPLAAGLGGVLVLGALLYWQFGPTASTIPSYQTPPMKMASDSSVMNDALTPTTIPASPAATTTSSDVNDISNLKRPADDTAPTSAMAPVTDASVPPPVTPTAVTTTTTTSAPVSPVQAAVPAKVNSPYAPAVSAPVSSAAVTAPVSAPAATTTTTVVQGSSTDQRLNALSNRVEDLQKSLAQATQQLSQVSAQLSSRSSETSSSSSDAAIDARLDKIEQRLNHKTSSAPDISTSSEESYASAKKHVTHHARTVSRTTHRTAHRTSTPARSSTAIAHDEMPRNLQMPGEIPAAMSPPIPSSMPTHWVLRAATPNEAWVATDATTPDLRHVQKGDELPGIGRIKDIRQSGNGWTVVGTQGSL